MFLLFIVISTFHWIGMVIAANSHRARINGHINDAHQVAGFPGITKKKRVTTDTGRVFSVEPSGEVFLVQGSEEFLLSPDDVPAATFARTLVVRVPAVLFRKTLGRLIFSAEAGDELDDTTDQGGKETIKTIDTNNEGETKIGRSFSGATKKAGARRRN